MAPGQWPWLWRGHTYPDAWLPTLASGTWQPCSRVSLEKNRTLGVNKGTQWRTESHGRE
jgi:hypothetical protein